LNNQLDSKPDTPKWTDRQWQAITAGGQDILVAAAAGSGKTAVLVERIIRRITDEDDALDVDRLLVVTFTDAAAAEMRVRIGEALEKELAKRPDSLALKRQLTLVNKANISTFHSFCLSVLRRHYYLIDLDPAFRIADSIEIELLQEEVLADLFEEEYEKSRTGHDESFYRLVDCYSNDRSDLPLQRLVLKLYSFARSNPWPREWLAEIAANYRVEAGANNEDIPWVKELQRQAVRKLIGLRDLLVKALAICQKPGGPTPYLPNIQEELAQLEEIISAGEKSWNDLAQALHGSRFNRVNAVRGKNYDQDLKEQAGQMRNKAKDRVREFAGGLFSRPLEDYLADLGQMAPVVERLVKLLVDFDRVFREAKKERGIIDYGDMEHFSLAILLDPSSTYGRVVPSSASLEYRQKFLEVLVDEYQDTNMVQETILCLIAGGQGRGNLFMVGDVKQSIYRFRLAEPELFLGKHKEFRQNLGQRGAGLLIDLAHNFRSRQEILAGTNYIFKQLMDEAVGEIAYDGDAELVFGAKDYPDAGACPVELLVIDRQGVGLAEDRGSCLDSGEWEDAGEEEVREQGETDSQGERETDMNSGADALDLEELEVMELEARLLAEKIKELTGANGSAPFQVYDRKLTRMRPVNYRDMVILLRASKGWAPAILEELKRQGIPAYAELTTGYFEATEVAVVMSLLKVIDNPYQDIPLAAVLRSPLVGLSGDQLAQIRLKEQQKNFYEAVTAYLMLREKERDEEICQKLTSFNNRLREWRTRSRQGSLADLIWQIYLETGYYDFVGGMPGGNQRQANLKALYHRGRQYEATSFRGLFSFLRFVERLQERGGDFGTARALGEQEDVVRVTTIHKSKGLEFPVVFLAGMGKRFNSQDLHQRFLFHKKLGFGSKLVDPEKRIILPTLLYLALRERLELELLAEEMRLLYVALTRAKEKLFLVGAVKDFAAELTKWQGQLSCTQWLLPDSDRASCKSYLDWVGRALVRHRDTAILRQSDGEDIFSETYHHPSRWQVAVYAAGDLAQGGTGLNTVREDIASTIMNCRQVAGMGPYQDEVKKRLNWSYGHPHATKHMAKLTVSEIKRQWEATLLMEEEDGRSLDTLVERLAERPRFLQSKKLSQAEKGTAMHQVMQHLELDRESSLVKLENQLADMVRREVLTPEQAATVQVEHLLGFLESELGRRLIDAARVEREIPFSLALPAAEVILEWGAGSTEVEQVLVQGVMDCVFFEDDGLVLLDYKTDAIEGWYAGGFNEATPILKERYRLQMELYSKAIEKIWQKPIKDKYLYFFDGGHLLKL